MSIAPRRLGHNIVHLAEDRSQLVVNLYALLLQAANCQPSALTTEKMVHIYNVFSVAFRDLIITEDEGTIRTMDRKEEIYQTFCQLVMKNYHRLHHVNEYADLMHITLPHLCATIRNASQRTAGDIVSEAILTDAKAQLKLTTLPIKEIALALGFENVAFFNRFFKQHIGTTPKVYRNTND